MTLKKRLASNNFKKIILFLFISFVLEFFIFNFRFFESFFFKNELLNLEITKFKNIEMTKKGTYKIKDPSNYIEITGINQKINNLYLDISSLDKVVDYTVYVKDEGNRLYYKLPKRTLTNAIESSKYIKLDLSGKAKSIRIRFKYYQDNDFLHFKNEIRINNICANVIRPLFFNFTRCIAIFLILLILYALRPRSNLYKYKFFSKNIKDKKFKKISIILFVIFHILLFYALTNLNSFFKDPNKYNQLEYNMLAQSFANKKVDIDYEVGETLKNLKNPYDRNYRDKKLLENNEEYLWDYAFYKNKYYVYFGVVPAIIAYYPFYMLTHTQLKNTTYIFVCCILIVIAILLLLKELCEKYFKNISTLHFLLVSFLFINSSYLLYAAKRPDLYNVPILSAIFFCILGLYFWFKSVNKEKLNLKFVFLGSLSMALVAGCRPQLLLSSLLSIFIFKDYIKEHKKIKDFLVFSIPYIIIGILLMYYNYIRFQSPFDFGANYNLTTNDMRLRGFNLDRVFLGIYYFLFANGRFSLVFPFINKITVETQYMGITVSEPLFGGILSCNLILLLGICSFKLKKWIKDNTLVKFSILCNGIALLLLLLDTQIAGILPRYILDFSWLLFLSTAISLFALFNSMDTYKKNIKYSMNTIFILFFIASILYNYLLIPVDLSYSLKYYNPLFYQKLANMVLFWL